MKRIHILLFLMLTAVALFAAKAFAEVDVKDKGKKVTTAVSIDFRGATVSKSGSVAIVDLSTLTGDTEITGALDLTGALDVFGDITGTGVINWDGDFEATGAMLANEAVWIKAVASNPCTGGGGVNWEDQSIFFNAGGDPCFCKGGAAKKMYDGTTNCY